MSHFFAASFCATEVLGDDVHQGWMFPVGSNLTDIQTHLVCFGPLSVFLLFNTNYIINQYYITVYKLQEAGGD